MLSDLRESGQPRAGRRRRLFIYRETTTRLRRRRGTTTSGEPRARRAHRRKHRNGPIGNVPLVFLDQYPRVRRPRRAGADGAADRPAGRGGPAARRARLTTVSPAPRRCGCPRRRPRRQLSARRLRRLAAGSSDPTTSRAPASAASSRSHASARPARLNRDPAAEVPGRQLRPPAGLRHGARRPGTGRRRAVRAFTDDIDAKLDEGAGLWLSGDVGTGKTSLAMLVSKAAVEAGRTVAIYSLPRLLARIRRTYDAADGEDSYLEFFDRLDLGRPAAHRRPRGREALATGCSSSSTRSSTSATQSQRSMIVTTNLPFARARGAGRRRARSRAWSRSAAIRCRFRRGSALPRAPA